MIGGGWVISPYPHAIFPVSNFFACDKRQCQVNLDDERGDVGIVSVQRHISLEI